MRHGTDEIHPTPPAPHWSRDGTRLAVPLPGMDGHVGMWLWLDPEEVAELREVLANQPSCAEPQTPEDSPHVWLGDGDARARSVEPEGRCAVTDPRIERGRDEYTEDAFHCATCHHRYYSFANADACCTAAETAQQQREQILGLRAEVARLRLAVTLGQDDGACITAVRDAILAPLRDAIHAALTELERDDGEPRSAANILAGALSRDGAS